MPNNKVIRRLETIVRVCGGKITYTKRGVPRVTIEGLLGNADVVWFQDPKRRYYRVFSNRKGYHDGVKCHNWHEVVKEVEKIKPLETVE